MSKAQKYTYWISTLWLALGMFSTGVTQLIMMKEGQGGVDMVLKLGYPVYLLYILGAWKLLGVVAVLVPKQPLVKEWAYAGFFFLTTGAIASHLFAHDVFVEVLPATLLLVLTVVSWKSRPADRTSSLVKG